MRNWITKIQFKLLIIVSSIAFIGILLYEDYVGTDKGMMISLYIVKVILLIILGSVILLNAVDLLWKFLKNKLT